MEPLTFNLFNVVVLFGVFQGSLLMSIFLFNKSYHKKSNFALVLVLLFSVLLGFGNTLEELKLYESYPIISTIPFFNNLLFPVGLYYFVVFLMDSSHKFSKKDYWFITPLIIQLTLNVGLFFFYLINPALIVPQKEARFLYYRLSDLLMFTYFFFIILFTLRKIQIYHQQLLDNYSEIEGKNLFWLRNIMLVLLPLWASAFFAQIYIFFYRDPPAIFYYNQVFISIIIYWLGYFILLRRDIFEIPTFKEIAPIKSILSDKTDEHYQNLLQLMQKEKLYKDAQLSMDTLAEKTQLSNGYLSKIINQKEGKNFYDFVNGFRVAEVKTYLRMPDYDHYSILGIGLEAGFKSKSTFNAVFKKMTGMTPTQFKKSLS